MSGPQETRAGDHGGVLAACLLIALTILVYLPAFDGGFLLDDDVYVTEDARMESAGGLGRIWTEVAGSDYKHQYYPLTSTAFWLQHQLWGEHSFGYHFVNVLLHAINAVLLWRLLRVLRVPWAWLAGAIFAVHPVHVQSVAWVSELKNVLSMMFFLMSALVFVRWLGLDGRLRSRLWYSLGVALFICALLSKTATCLLPVALALVVWWKRGRLVRRDLLALAFPAVIAAGFVSVTVYLEMTHAGARGPEFAHPGLERVLIAGRALWFYAAKLVWPAGLTMIYPRWEVSAASAWQYLYPVAAALAVGTLWALRGRLGRGPVTAAAFFVAAVAPLSFVNVAFMRLSFVADHWVYWASIGPIALVVAALARGSDSSHLKTQDSRLKTRSLRDVYEWIRVAVAVSVVGTLSALTWQRCITFQNGLNLWGDTVAGNPASWAAHNNLGRALSAAGRIDEAAGHFSEALRIRPDYARARYNLANCRAAQGRADEAIGHYRAAIDLDPDFADAHYNLGNSLREQGRYEESARHYRQAVRLDPGHAFAQSNLGGVLLVMGRHEEAAHHLRRALEIDPTLDAVRYNLQRAISRQPSAASRNGDPEVSAKADS